MPTSVAQCEGLSKALDALDHPVNKNAYGHPTGFEWLDFYPGHPYERCAQFWSAKAAAPAHYLQPPPVDNPTAQPSGTSACFPTLTASHVALSPPQSVVDNIINGKPAFGGNWAGSGGGQTKDKENAAPSTSAKRPRTALQENCDAQ